MSIVTFAVCEGCGYQMIADEHPDAWPIVHLSGSEKAFCSAICVRANFGAVALPSISRFLPLGMTEWDARYLEQVALGKTNKEIAVEFGRCESTVKNRLTQVFIKLDALDRTQAILLGHAVGIINIHQLAQRFADEHQHSDQQRRAA